MSNDLVLDLDEPDPGPVDDPVWWRTVKVPLWAVLALVLGAVLLATTATRLWDAREAAAPARAKPVILVDVPADSGLVGRGDGRTVTLRSAVQVINAGPQPIELETVASTSDGVTLHGDGDGRVIPAGTAGQVVVRGLIDCRTWVPTEPIQLRLDVRDADGVLRPAVRTVVIRGAWDDLLDTCVAGHK